MAFVAAACFKSFYSLKNGGVMAFMSGEGLPSYDEIIAQMPEVLTTEPDYNVDWGSVPMSDSAVAEFFQDFFNSVELVLSNVIAFLESIFTYPYIGIPILIFLFFSLMYLCGSFLLDFGYKGFGSSRLNTNFQLSKYPNPDKTFFHRYLIYKYDKKVNKNKPPTSSASSYDWNLYHARNLNSAANYFKNHPNKTKVTIDGEVFYNQKKH